MDYVRVYERAQGAPAGEPSAVPGRIEAEDFDLGGAGWAYKDFDPTNNGVSYRLDESVDIEPCSEGGFNIGWFQPGEWLEYSVDVQERGWYRFNARVAAPFEPGTFRLESDGVDVSGPVGMRLTGGWQSWNTVGTAVFLEAGPQVLRFVNTSEPGQGYNVNWFELRKINRGLPVHADDGGSGSAR